MENGPLVQALIDHQRRDPGGCLCGWGPLGASHAEHVAGIVRPIVEADVRGDEQARRVDVNILRGFDLGLAEAEAVAARLVAVVCRLDADVRAEQAASEALLLSWRRTRAERDRARDEAAESTAHLINCRGDLAFAREDVDRLRQEITEHIHRADVLRAVLTQVESDRDTAFADARASLAALVEAVDPASAPCDCDEPPCAWHTKDHIEDLARGWAK